MITRVEICNRKIIKDFSVGEVDLGSNTLKTPNLFKHY